MSHDSPQKGFAMNCRFTTVLTGFSVIAASYILFSANWLVVLLLFGAGGLVLSGLCFAADRQFFSRSRLPIGQSAMLDLNVI
jgi:hypothetical protein